MNPEAKISFLVIMTVVFGLVVWRISNKVFSANKRIQDSKFEKSEYRKRWKRK
jgi:NhaP-type Na+/H+ or K+/H+ antiporter